MKSRIPKLLTLLILASAFLVSCNNDDDEQPGELSLYERLGGEAMVNDPANPGRMIEQGRLNLRAVVDSTIFVIAGDPRLTPYFPALLSEVGSGNLSGFATLSKNLTDFFAQAAGSKNFRYTGLNMRDAHDPARNPRMAMKSDNAAYDHFVEDVVKGAQQNNVPNEIIAEVGALLATLRTDVVQR